MLKNGWHYNMQEIIEHLIAYENKTGGLSFIKRDNSDYQAILAYGDLAIPTLLHSIDNFGWCVIVLLGEITGEHSFPKEDAGYYSRILAAWKKWGAEKGYI
jgi:hypothetical protein